MNRPTPPGFALPAAIMALVILAVLITGAIYMAEQEFRIGWSTDQASRAFNMTERSVDEVLINWEHRTYSALAPWSSANASGTLPDGRWSATVTKMSDFFYYVDVTGVVSRGGILRAGASHRIGTIVHITAASIDPPAAVSTRGNILVRGNAKMSGQDSIPPGFEDMCTEPLDNRPGVAIDSISTVNTSGQGDIDGDPPVMRDPTINDDTFTDFGNVDWNELVRMADVRPPPGNLNVAPSLRADGTCNTGDFENWGDPEVLGSPCANYFPVVFINGDASIQANGRGQGVLLVAGNLDLRGNFTYHGIVIVQGSFQTQGVGNKVYGGVMAGNAMLGTEDLTGDSEVQFSSCAIRRVILNSTLTRARRLPNRSWVDVSYLTY